MVVVATLFFALGNAILDHPAGHRAELDCPGERRDSTFCCSGVAVALWDAFDEGHALRAGMGRSFLGSMLVAVVFGGQFLIGLAAAGRQPAPR